jgi:cation diffusion facilitator CzcD-associated flavoprotein CzcO
MSGFKSDNPAADCGADVEVAIIGSGFSGLCMAIKLKQQGIENFVILEKDAVFGGTWRVNHYPGAACDVPSHLYSFSFAQNASWSRKFPLQTELLRYTESLVEDYRLLLHIRLDTALTGADFDEEKGIWRVRTSKGEFTAKSVVIATGALSRPVIPALAGLETFQGRMFHSAEWQHDYDLSGKRVAVIGTGASAIQFVPEIAGKVAQLDLYQRTPPWVMPRPDRAISAIEKWLLQRVKPLQLLYRGLTYLQYEMRLVIFAKLPALTGPVQWLARRHIRKQIPHDAELRKKVTPDYMLGCKRILLMNGYYPALARSNVAVLTGGIAEVRAHSVVGNNGEERQVDAIIFGTGFDVQHSLGALQVRGRGGRLLSEVAEPGLEAYKGTTVSGFPNFFMITGPNTGLGHNSMIYMIESGVTYLTQAIGLIRQQGLHSVEVLPQVQAAYNRALQRRLHGTVWDSGCKSWYLTKDGKNNTLWPGFTFEYRRITRHFDAVNYRVLKDPPAESLA